VGRPSLLVSLFLLILLGVLNLRFGRAGLFFSGLFIHCCWQGLEEHGRDENVMTDEVFFNWWLEDDIIIPLCLC